MAIWLESGKAIGPPFIGSPKNGWAPIILASYTVFWVLLGLNAWQSFLIIRKAIGFDAPRSGTVESNADWQSRYPWYVNVIIQALTGALTFVLMIAIIVLAMFAFYFAWFAAVGDRG